MQCVNCGFENMPGMETCVRCQSSLQLGAVAIEPPRASHLRIVNHWRRMRNIAGECIRSLENLPVPEPIRALMRLAPSSFVPGAALIGRGYSRTGWLVLIGWLWLLAMSALNGAIGLGQIYLTVAVALHAICLVRLLRPSAFNDISGPMLSFSVFLLLRVLVYAPINLLLDRFYGAFPVDNLRPAGLIQDGDVLLYHGPWAPDHSINRGDIVVYRLDAQSGGHYRVEAGYGLDRVLGMPGEHVTVKAGTLYVNGKAIPRLSPLGIILMMEGFDATAGSNDYIIFPSAMNITMHGSPGNEILHRASHVKAQDIMGHVFFRTQPLQRWGRLK